METDVRSKERDAEEAKAQSRGERAESNTGISVEDGGGIARRVVSV